MTSFAGDTPSKEPRAFGGQKGYQSPCSAIARGLLAIALLALAGACREEITVPPPPADVPVIRALVLDDQDVARITIDGPFEVRILAEGDAGREVASGSEFGTHEVRADGEDVIVAEIVRTASVVELVPKGVAVEVGGRSYRGSLRVLARDGVLHVVNAVDVESYLQSVVAKEAYPGWPAAALQAQAIAARSYAMAKMERTSDRHYDVKSTTADQVYMGLDIEADGPTAAVDATRGQVLRLGGRVLVAYFHACCGGHTTDARFGVGDLTSPLGGVPCGACTECPHYEWSVRIAPSELGRRLGVADLKGIRIQSRGEHGRVRSVVLLRRVGQKLAMDGARFRSQARLRSTRFDAKADGDDFLFEGRGFGHGVGLCQWGAKGLADRGQTTEQILSRYYPDAVIWKAY
jgi:stage II sporulation protein D